MLILIFNISRFYFQRLEQEKHILRRKLSEAESEGDIRAQELESDYNDLKSKVMSQVSDRLNRLVIFLNINNYFQHRKHRFDKTKEKRIF